MIRVSGDDFCWRERPGGTFFKAYSSHYRFCQIYKELADYQIEESFKRTKLNRGILHHRLLLF